MKKSMFVKLLVVYFMLFSQLVQAEEPIRVTIDNNTQDFAQAPIKIDNVVMVPVKATMEGLKANVWWDEERSMVHIFAGERALSVQKGNQTATVSYYDPSGDAYINPESVVLETEPVVINGSLFIALVDLKVYLDVKALWDEDDNVVRIFTDAGDVNYLEYKRELEPDGELMAQATADKNGVQIQVGNMVVSTGFYGHVEQINGDNLYVYWTGKTDLIKDKDVPFMAFIAQINYGGRSWIKSSEVAVVQQ